MYCAPSAPDGICGGIPDLGSLALLVRALSQDGVFERFALTLVTADPECQARLTGDFL